jgi:hypothetical protein
MSGSADMASRSSSGRRIDPLVVAATALAGVVPTLVLGWAVNEHLWELWWLEAGADSGLLDGRPDRAVVVSAAVGIGLLVGVTVAAHLVMHSLSAGRLTHRQAAGRALLAVGIPVALLVLALLLQIVMPGAEGSPPFPFADRVRT